MTLRQSLNLSVLWQRKAASCLRHTGVQQQRREQGSPHPPGHVSFPSAQERAAGSVIQSREERPLLPLDLGDTHFSCPPWECYPETRPEVQTVNKASPVGRDVPPTLVRKPPPRVYTQDAQQQGPVD